MLKYEISSNYTSVARVDFPAPIKPNDFISLCNAEVQFREVLFEEHILPDDIRPETDKVGWVVALVAYAKRLSTIHEKKEE